MDSIRLEIEGYGSIDEFKVTVGDYNDDINVLIRVLDWDVIKELYEFFKNNNNINAKVFNSNEEVVIEINDGYVSEGYQLVFNAFKGNKIYGWLSIHSGIILK